MKRKLLILSGLGIVIVSLFTWWIIPKGIRIGYVKLPKEISSTKLDSSIFSEYIENVDSLDGAIKEIYKESNVSLIRSSKTFKKYSNNFFRENFLYISSIGRKYSYSISERPYFHIKHSYVTKECILRIEAFITSKSNPYPHVNETDFYYGLGYYPPPDPHGYILEIPRKEFEKYKMTYDDIEIAYLNSNDYYYNVQVGKNKGKYDPKYPMPNNADFENSPKEPKFFFPLLEDE